MTAIPGLLNYDSDFPVAPAGKINITWQVDTGVDGIAHLSAYLASFGPGFTDDYIPKFTATGTFENSRLQDDGTYLTLDTGSFYVASDGEGLAFGAGGSATESIVGVHASEMQFYVNSNLDFRLNALDSASQMAMEVRHDGSLKAVKTFDDGAGHAVLYVDL